MREKIIKDVTQFAKDDNNAVICILKEGERFSALIEAKEEDVIANMLANVMIDNHEFGTLCFQALNKVLDIKFQKLQENENEHSRDN